MPPRVYYNEIDKFAVKWLRKLMEGGHIPHGAIDTRSILEVQPEDLEGFDQCHFFAGIGGWAYAIKLAGFDTLPCWTGSPPCQPFSSAGKQQGKKDERHLWPAQFRLIQQCRPARFFGEQVANAITHGWWDDVALGLEMENYATGAAVLPACAIGKPHQRNRLFFMAHSRLHESGGRDPIRNTITKDAGAQAANQGSGSAWGGEAGQRSIDEPANGGAGSSDVGNASQQPEREPHHEGHAKPVTGEAWGVSSSAGDRCGGNVGIAQRTGLEGHAGNERTAGKPGWNNAPAPGSVGTADTHWIACPDGKSRPVEPGICLLVNGFPNRVGALRGFGNAIVPGLAANFMQAAVAAEREQC